MEIDVYAIAGKLLHQIFLPMGEGECRTDEILKRPVYAPLQVVTGLSSPGACMHLHTDARSFAGYTVFRAKNPLFFSAGDLRQWGREVSLRIALAFKVKVDVEVSCPAQSPEEAAPFVLSRAVDRHNDAEAVELFIPLYFFSHLAGISLEADGDTVEEKLELILRDGLTLFPDISILLDRFDSVQLQRLISQLRQNKMLTVYQLSLLCRALPHHAIKIKHALSRNTVKEVSEMLNRMHGDATFSERDCAIGVYSVEEAMYHLLIAGGEVQYSSYLRELQHLVSEIQARETFLIKSFPDWIETIEREGLLYHVLIKIPDLQIAVAFCGERSLFEKICGKIFTRRKIDDIRSVHVDNITLNDILHARSTIVSEYRSLCVKRKNWGAESFEYIVRGINDAASFRRLLLETGWFTLSTALKNMRREIVAKVIAAFPKPARFLIEDVLRGVLNPNILHDELQIQEARARCVHKALELYEKGVIRLVL